MDESNERSQFLSLLEKSPAERTDQDLDMIRNHIRKIPYFQNYQVKDLKNFASSIRFKCCQPNEIVFRKGDQNEDWFFVYKGEVKVLIGIEDNVDQTEELCIIPEGESFGKSLEGSNTQETATVVAKSETDLLILDPVTFESATKPMKKSPSQTMFEEVPDYIVDQAEKELASGSTSSASIPPQFNKQTSLPILPSESSSSSPPPSSDTPSAPRSRKVSFEKKVSFEGSPRGSLDKGKSKIDEFGSESFLFDPDFQEMDESDIKDFLLQDFRHLKAFSKLSSTMQAELSRVVSFQFSEKAGEYIFKQGDVGTSWYVIYKGSVDVVVNGNVVVSLTEGDGFGDLALITDKPRAASIVTKEDGCQFIVVDKKDFIKIQQEINNNTIKLEEHGQVVLVLEKKEKTETKNDVTETKQYYAVMAGTTERLARKLLEENDDNFVEVFLFSFRMFMTEKDLWTILLKQFEQGKEKLSNPETEKMGKELRDRVIWAIDKWIRTHPVDFRTDQSLMNTLIKFVEKLKSEKQLQYYDKIHSAMIYQRLDPSTRSKVRGVSIYQGAVSSPAWGEEEKPKKADSVRDMMRKSFNKLRRRPSEVKEDSNLLKSYNQTSSLAKVYLPTGNYKTLNVQASTTAFEIMHMALDKFGMSDQSAFNFNLIEVRTNGTSRQFEDDETSVLSGMSINGRLYLRRKGTEDALSPPPFPIRPPHMQTMFIEMDISEVARIMTLLDHESLNKINPLEFMFHIFKIKGRTIDNLNLFVNRFNEVNLWVVTEILSKDNVYKRAIVIKKFIDLALLLISYQNFNSGFAILSGLGNVSVTRLAQTWKKISSNLMMEFERLQKLMDPSRNMKTYRTLLINSKPPLIPFFPLLMKDIFFLNDCNDNKTSDGLVNFEKFRMIAEIVKVVDHYRKVPFDNLLQPNKTQSRLDRKRMSIVSENFLERQFTNQEISEFLSNLYVIDDPRALSNLSYEVEPKVTTPSS